MAGGVFVKVRVLDLDRRNNWMLGRKKSVRERKLLLESFLSNFL